MSFPALFSFLVRELALRVLVRTILTCVLRRIRFEFLGGCDLGAAYVVQLELLHPLLRRLRVVCQVVLIQIPKLDIHLLKLRHPTNDCERIQDHLFAVLDLVAEFTTGLVINDKYALGTENHHCVTLDAQPHVFVVVAAH